MNVPALTPGFDAVFSVFSQIVTFVQHIKGAETWVFTISPSAVLELFGHHRKDILLLFRNVSYSKWQPSQLCLSEQEQGPLQGFIWLAASTICSGCYYWLFCSKHKLSKHLGLKEIHASCTATRQECLHSEPAPKGHSGTVLNGKSDPCPFQTHFSDLLTSTLLAPSQNQPNPRILFSAPWHSSDRIELFTPGGFN